MRYSFCQLLKRLTKNRAWRAYVKPHETSRHTLLLVEKRGVRVERSIEDFAIIERQSGFVDKEVLKVVVVKTQRTAIEPYEE